MPFFTDFKLEGLKFLRHCTLTSRYLSCIAESTQNYPVFDNHSVNFSMILNINE